MDNFSNKNLSGLYRRYDGRYFLVYGTVDCIMNDKRELCVEMSHLGMEEYKVALPLKEFTKKTYTLEVVDDEGNHIIRIEKLLEHPDNKLSQETMFAKIENLDDFAVNMSNEQLIRELAKRDCITQDLDIKGLNDKVYCSELVVGTTYEEHQVNGRTIPKGVKGKYICDNYKSVVETLEKDRNNKVFKRVWVKLNEEDILTHLQEEVECDTMTE